MFRKKELNTNKISMRIVLEEKYRVLVISKRIKAIFFTYLTSTKQTLMVNAQSAEGSSEVIALMLSERLTEWWLEWPNTGGWVKNSTQSDDGVDLLTQTSYGCLFLCTN